MRPLPLLLLALSALVACEPGGNTDNGRADSGGGQGEGKKDGSPPGDAARPDLGVLPVNDAGAAGDAERNADQGNEGLNDEGVAPPDGATVEDDGGRVEADMAEADAAVAPPDMADPDAAVAPPDMAGPECADGEERACGGCAGGVQACADGAWGECAFPAETCDGADNDCDGEADEDFPGLGDACAAGVGGCTSAGVQVCGPDGDAVVCNAVPGGANAETCDGTDEDCDGEVDEGLRGECYPGPEGTLGVGACRAGTAACVGGQFDACEGAVVPADEICNGVDDDCDGVVDEAEGGGPLVEACYDGPEGTAGVGICSVGQRTCVDGGFGACEGQVLPGVEICDMRDNSCSGEVDDTDEGCECIPGTEQDCYSGAEGTLGVGACAAGRQRCSAEGRYGACEGETVPGEEICDGEDNDCDGEVDDGAVGTGRPCGVGVGACRTAGVMACDSETGEVFCDAVAGEPRPEICNGEDDDCDEVVDDGLGLGEACQVGRGACVSAGVLVCDGEGSVVCDANAGDPRPELCNGVDDDCDGVVDDGLGLGDACSVGVGQCVRQGRRICNDQGGTRCSVDPAAPQPEVCDGLDNDCDGVVDDGNPGGGADCPTGLPGACAVGQLVCANAQLACRQTVQPAREVCDGLDNDCNGREDDDGEGVLTRDCYDGNPQTLGVGACRGGRSTCRNGDFGACEGQVLPRGETCDGVDNDCNGAVDDVPGQECVCDPGQQQACYTGREGTEDVGACRGGQQTCLGDGSGFGPCQGEVVPVAEACDGIDNDCNGAVDDAPGVGVGCSEGQGACLSRGQLVCRGNELVCNAEIIEPGPEVCSGRDDDCNGVVDDVDGIGEPCTAGLGICARAGTQECGQGALVCNAQPGQPDDVELCNGEDDDCDGTVDEDPDDAGAECATGVGACEGLGNEVCVGGQLVCDAVEGEPSAEVCNLRDDDCDGAVDDAPVDVGQDCSVGVGACARDGLSTCVRGQLGCDAQAGQPGVEFCGDGDQDCDGQTDEGLNCTVYRSCAHALEAGNGASGVYYVAANDDVPPQNVWCDQATDGGGWTLVGSTLNSTLNDQASAWYADLRTLAPAQGNPGVWNGLRPLGARFDVRFACRAEVGAADAPFDVDLSFYDVGWYDEMTTGTDAESCFSESNGAFDDSPVPARRDNVGGRYRRKANLYDGVGNYLEGEDSCGDAADFTVDFDDRGMDSNQGDGTDWGEDDGARKCGASGLAGGQWFVFARERPRVAVVGLAASVTTLLRGEGILADRLTYDDALPGKLTTDRYDTVVIGRYATSWARMTQPLKEALDAFGRGGGNVLTEWEGAAIFMNNYEQTFRYANGAPNPLRWFDGGIDNGDSRGSGTPITQTVPGDGIFAGVANPFSGAGATEFFFTVDDAWGGELTIETREVATFAGGTASFPDAVYPAIQRGRYCGGNAIFATFDWQDGPANAGLGPLVANMVREASLPPPADLAEGCNDQRRAIVMQCGASSRNLADFGIGGRVLQSCVPNDDTQVMFVTRSGAANLDQAGVRAYLNGGGIVVTEYNVGDEVFNLVFGTNVAQAAARSGNCGDNVMPTVQQSPHDGFWQDNRFVPQVASTGCGYDVSAFTGLIPLGGWDANTTSIGYRDYGAGRVWIVEADWQDGSNAFTEASRGLMRYMGLTRAGGGFGRGADFFGVRQNVRIHDYLQRGFEVCYRGLYNESVDLDPVLEACHGEVLLMGCRPVGQENLQVAAMGDRAEVITDVGVGNDAVNPHNGVDWYFNASRSWGFAPVGEGVNRNSCDTTNQANNDRICWHTSNNRMTGGWRCGSNTGLNGSVDFERVVLHRSGDVPVDIIIQ